MTKGLDRYLQDAEQLRALEVNYFDDTARPTNTSLMSETTEQVNESSQNNLPTAKHESIEDVDSAINTLESKDRHWPYFMMSTSTEKYCALTIFWP